MGISLQAYRIQIGSFNSNQSKSKTKSTNQSSRKQSTNLVLNTFLSITTVALLFTVFLPLVHSHLSVTAPAASKPNIPREIFNLRYQFKWPQHGVGQNKLQKLINGNRRSLGYKLAVWNCGRGLLSNNSSKLIEIKQYIEKHKPHTFGIIESDLHGLNSRANRANKYSTAEVKEALKIDGYEIELPSTWETHGQARLIAYISKDVKYSRKVLISDLCLLPSISLQIGFGKA